MKSQIAKIRPAARLISTIGQDLIGDVYAAIIELVKNSYDADATHVNITFKYHKINDTDILNIEIEDDGHGMSTDAVLKSWLVPATNNKILRNESPRKRTFQGKKGIGRYAAATLGQQLIMKTTDSDQITTEVLIDWSLFDKEEFLEDIDILVTSQKSTLPSGTTLFIKATGEKLSQWTSSELDLLTRELRRLKSPLQSFEKDDFKINIAFIDCPFDKYNNEVLQIESFPIIELFDYRISGRIDENGNLDALYENNVSANLPKDKISFKIKLENGGEYCGQIDFDLRVFDRDPEAISNLINKGLIIDPINKTLAGKREATKQLNEVYGVNIYREGFRIRPYGNGGIDWLDLDKSRIQNFSVRVSNNQVVGFINIKPESVSKLEEKSARDGLKENRNYSGLVEQVKKALSELEIRRFEFRQKTGRGRKNKNITKELENLFDYSQLTSEISTKLNHLKINPSLISEFATIIHKDAERKTKLLENLQSTIAIYQGQATLGKIVTVLLHEGRKPIQYFRQQSPNLAKWLELYKERKNWDDTLYSDILERLINFRQQSDILADLFKRLDPLAKQNRSSKKLFSLSTAISKAIHIFENQLIDEKITCVLECDKTIELNGWEDDIIIALTNLIENSIYWLNQTEKEEKHISIDVHAGDGDILIHYKDNGPGIDKSLIESSIIFEPGFSKKLGGTGLGLPIAGEAIERLGGDIVAHHWQDGAYFTIELKNK